MWNETRHAPLRVIPCRVTCSSVLTVCTIGGGTKEKEKHAPFWIYLEEHIWSWAFWKLWYLTDWNVFNNRQNGSVHNIRFLFTDINSAWKEPFAGKYISLFYKAFLLSHNVVLFIFCYINVDNQVECAAVSRVSLSTQCGSASRSVRDLRFAGAVSRL